VEEIKYIIKESEQDVISITKFLLVLKKRFLLFAATSLIIFSVALLWIFSSKPYYNTKVSIGSAYFTGNAIEPMINALADLRKDGNYEALAKQLNISVAEASSILKIEIRNKVTQKDFYSADIALKLSNPNNVPAISDGFMQYFDNNAFIKNRVQIMQAELLDFTTNGERELVRLDSLKKSLQQVLNNKDKVASNIIFPSNIHLEAVNINEKVYQARQDLKLVKGVELLSKPSIPNKSSNPSKLLLITFALLGGLFISAFVTVFADNILD
jgi:LPS O-antigen subunit length determinant protein (WzzB/FepE family)